MNIGIIVEYNPFHNGHKLHIEKTKTEHKAQKIIAVMSGNFVQRGEPAILDKFKRTKTALLNGVDLVLELPAVYSTSAADIFAYGAIDILNKSNIIDGVCFGSESGSLNALKEVCEILSNESTEFKKALSIELSSGVSYPKARLNAVQALLKKDLSFLNQPNNILALEYMKALKQLNSKIKPLTIQRELADFHSTNITSEIASATAIRNAIHEKSFNKMLNTVPENSHIYYNANNFYPSINDYTTILHYLLRIKSKTELSEIADITEGLENRILKLANFSSITALMQALKTKRYTYTKLQRALLHIILDIKKTDVELKAANPYIKVLGFKRESSYLLSELCKKATVPVLTNLKNAEKQLSKEAFDFLKKELIISDIYNLFDNKQLSLDYTLAPIII